jgi:hypothetical protein
MELFSAVKKSEKGQMNYVRMQDKSDARTEAPKSVVVFRVPHFSLISVFLNVPFFSIYRFSFSFVFTTNHQRK